MCKEAVFKALLMDASFLVTSEVLLLTVGLFCLRWGNRKQKRPTPLSGWGGTVSKKDQTDFHSKQRRPNRISSVSRKDQTKLP